MSNTHVLRAATIQGVRALGLAQDLGSIEPRKLADIVILSKDPLADIHNMKFSEIRDEERRDVRGRDAE